ncbi:MAG: hypothetical protein GOU99_01385, partial [Candidatus Altiarchaeota archaeon]|nr:hypothetical protein [Candidatus Altiarchaeota archaeon]
MRRLFVLLFLLATIFSAQINPHISGAAVETAKCGAYYVIGTMNALYLFDAAGNIVNFIELRGLQDLECTDQRIAIATTDQQFPNIIEYDFELNKLSEFEPKTKSFHETLVWIEKETKSWKLSYVGDSLAVASGSNLYLVKNGQELARFTAGKDIWDFEYDGEFYAVSQDGFLYKLDSSLNLIEQTQICEDFEIKDPISNVSKGTVTRSVWSVEINDGIWTACEDGQVCRDGRCWTVKDYSYLTLQTYFSRLSRETGVGDDYFKNIQLYPAGDGLIGYSSDKLVFFDEVELWERSLTVSGDMCSLDSSLFIPSGREYGVLVIKELSLSGGSTLDELRIETPFQASSFNLFCDDDYLIISSQYEVIKTDYNGNIQWAFHRPTAVFHIADEIFAGGKQQDPSTDPQLYYLMAVDESGVKWEYSIPKESWGTSWFTNPVVGLNYIGFAQKTNQGNHSFIVLDRRTGELVRNKITDMIYAGHLDTYLLNSSFMTELRKIDRDSLNSIPQEIWEGRIAEASLYYGPENVQAWLDELAEIKITPQTLQKFMNFDLNYLDGYLMRPQVQRVDGCDIDNDGKKDFLISADSYFVVLSGANATQIMLVDSQNWRYDNEINRDLLDDYTQDWFQNGGTVLCVGDLNNDNKQELLHLDWESYSLYQSNTTGYQKKWGFREDNLRQDAVRVIDYDLDGNYEIFLSNWRENMPEVWRVINPDNLETIVSGEGNQAFPVFLGDLNQDGQNEAAFVYEREGMRIKLFGSYNWEFASQFNLWETWSSSQNVRPICMTNDVNKDDVYDILLGLIDLQSGEFGTMVLSGRDGSTLVQPGDAMGQWAPIAELSCDEYVTAILPQTWGGQGGSTLFLSNELDQLGQYSHQMRSVSGGYYLRSDGGLDKAQDPNLLGVNVQTDGKDVSV